MERLSRLNAALKRHGITLIFVPVPVRGIIAAAHLGPDVKQPIGFDASQAVEEHRVFVDQIRQAGVEAVDLTHSLLANPNREELWYKRDAHWTPEGARDAARVIAGALERLDILKGVPRVAYKSTLSEIKINELRMPLALQRFCTEVLPLEQFEFSRLPPKLHPRAISSAATPQRPSRWSARAIRQCRSSTSTVSCRKPPGSPSRITPSKVAEPFKHS